MYGRVREEKIIYKKILGIEGEVYLDSKEMARHLRATFLVSSSSSSLLVNKFIKKLKRTLYHLGTKIIPYEKALTKANKIKEGIVVFTSSLKGEDLPINHVSSFTSNQIITIMENSSSIKDTLPFDKRIERAMKLFAWHMSNLIICLNKQGWRIYNFNGSFPNYKFDKDFRVNVLDGLISKITTPIRPLHLSEFTIKKKNKLELDRKIVEDFINGSLLLGKMG
ncbi:MAG: hypothetical protein NC817_01465, partial [Candidatus Omnitrophica bacterium]|nr:hypothetical protein [Candidatus Omnitrophota bacterium]